MTRALAFGAPFGRAGARFVHRVRVLERWAAAEICRISCSRIAQRTTLGYVRLVRVDYWAATSLGSSDSFRRRTCARRRPVPDMYADISESVSLGLVFVHTKTAARVVLAFTCATQSLREVRARPTDWTVRHSAIRSRRSPCRRLLRRRCTFLRGTSAR